MPSGRNLLIVESPGKIKKLEKILGPDWDVVASIGHIQDISSENGELGFDKQTLEINYVLSDTGKRQVRTIKSMMKENDYDRIVIASDPDREGETIAEHLRIRLGLKEGQYERGKFNAITKSKVLEAISTTGVIHKPLVHAQESRRMLDRAVGWESSAALSQKLGKMSPVGRVQSQAVLYIVRRDQEIKNFKVVQHFDVKLFSKTNSLGEESDNEWSCTLDKYESGLLKKPKKGKADDETVIDEQESYWTDKELGQKLADNIKRLEVISNEVSNETEHAPMPFHTSTLQQAAINKLGFTSKKTAEVSQRLYEAGHITYHRTDSDLMSDDGFQLLTEYANAKGLPVVGEKREPTKSNAVAQEAHEAIRPSSFFFEGDELDDKDEKSLYVLIWQRALASQLKPTVYDRIDIKLKGSYQDKDYTFKTSSRVIREKGWRVILDADDTQDDDNEDEESFSVPNLEIGANVKVSKGKLLSRKTTPPKPYTEATLINKMEREGVGRPSTYASIIEKINGHGYVVQTEQTNSRNKKKKFLSSTSSAEDLVNNLYNVLDIMDTAFTKKMEEDLDAIANDKLDYVSFMHNFLSRLDEQNKLLLHDIKFPCEKCNGGMVRVKTKKENYYWRCGNKCGNKAFDLNGRPASPEEIAELKQLEIKKFSNQDGSPKFPCELCGSALVRRESSQKKGCYYWRCSKDIEGCEGYAYDDKDTQTPIFDLEAFKREKLEKELKRFTNPDGKPKFACPECGNALVRREKNKEPGSFYWICVTDREACEFITFENKEGEPVLDVEAEKQKRAEIKQRKIEECTDSEGKPLYPCPECGGPMYKNRSAKNPKTFWFGCLDYPTCKTTVLWDKVTGKPNYKAYKEEKSGKGKKKTTRKKK